MAETKEILGLSYPDKNGFSKIINRMKEAAQVKSGRALSVALGFTPSAVQVAKQRSLIPMAWIVLASIKFNASADWLIYGKSSIEAGSDFITLPVIELKHISGQELVRTELTTTISFLAKWLRAKGLIDQLILSFAIDNAMAPLIKANDFILINTGDQEISESGIFVVAYNNRLFIKHLNMEPGKIIMRADNKNLSPDITVNFDEVQLIKILGRVVWWSHDE